jgi:hypothetical protein
MGTSAAAGPNGRESSCGLQGSEEAMSPFIPRRAAEGRPFHGVPNSLRCSLTHQDRR